MQQSLYSILTAISLLAIVACNKGESNTTPEATNSFKVDNSTYVIKEAYISGITFKGVDSFNNEGSVTFGGGSPSEKTYNILGTDEFDFRDGEALVGFSRNGKRYYSTGQPAAKVTVSYPDGKLKVVCPEIWLKANTGTQDSVKFSGIITQTR